MGAAARSGATTHLRRARQLAQRRIEGLGVRQRGSLTDAEHQLRALAVGKLRSARRAKHAWLPSTHRPLSAHSQT